MATPHTDSFRSAGQLLPIFDRPIPPTTRRQRSDSRLSAFVPAFVPIFDRPIPPTTRRQRSDRRLSAFGCFRLSLLSAVDIVLQGQTVHEQCEIAQLAGGTPRALVLEFQHIPVKDVLTVEFKPRQGSADPDNSPIIHALEVLRQD